MRKVAIIGNAGGGKSTLGLRMSARHALPFFSVDQLQWLPGWVAVPERKVQARLDQLAETDAWVIDGWGPWPSIERRLSAADTIVFVDLPLWVHFWLAAKRQIEAAQGIDRCDPLEGCDQLDVTKRIFEMIWQVDAVLKPRLCILIDRFKTDRAYHHVTSMEALEALG